ncbi:MAG: hypothetical protein ABSF84_12805 [Acidimicrobiales bacterium]|jgi:hypothetical protein
MTVRLTPSESELTPTPQVPPQPDPSVVQVTTTEEAADGRRALREARRRRRRTTWICAAFVALCLALTIVVVTLARYRTAPTLPSVGAIATSIHPDPSGLPPPAGPRIDSTVLPSTSSLGAAAPEGGTR